MIILAVVFVGHKNDLETLSWSQFTRVKEKTMLATVLIVILVLALVGALPRWSHSRNCGYAPTGGLGLVLVIVLILVLVGRL